MAVSGHQRVMFPGWRSRQKRSADTSSVTEDAYFAISHFAVWINNADTKAGFLLAAWTVLVGALSASADRIQRAVPVVGARSLASMIFLCGTAAGLLATAYLLVSALSPRLPAPGFSRFAFPNVADAELSELRDSRTSTAREEAWRQARQLAQIALAKFTAIRRAVRFLIFSGLAALLWSVLAK
jgi:hypothetical protein